MNMSWKGMASGQMIDKSPYDHFVEIDDISYHYREYPARGKNAEHVVLLHGFASSTYSWEKIDYRLHEEGYHVWSLDLKGFGWSDKPRNGDYDILTIMEELNKWMVAMKIDDAIVVANSYGGGVALLLSFNYPKRIKKMVLIDNAGLRMRLPSVMHLISLPLAGLVGKIIFGRWMVKLIVREVFHNKRLITDEQIDAYHARMSTTNATDAQIALCRAIDFDKYELYYSRIREIKQKTLIVWGKNDAWIPLELGYRLNDMLPDARLVIIPECGHIPQEEKPETVFRLVLDFARGRDVFATFRGTISGNVCAIDEQTA